MGVMDGQVQDVLEKARLSAVIRTKVSLEKSGSDLLGLCPFHEEKTPSFVVNDGKGVYKCFGCGRNGNAIDFVMETEGKSYYEAVVALADRYGVGKPEGGV